MTITLNLFDIFCLIVAAVSGISFVYYYFTKVLPARALLDEEEYVQIVKTIKTAHRLAELKDLYAEIQFNRLRRPLFKEWSYQVAVVLQSLHVAVVPVSPHTEVTSHEHEHVDTLETVPSPNQSDEFNNFLKAIYQILTPYERERLTKILSKQLRFRVVIFLQG
jgi:hypothetical protein